jgi:hypothetical protein
MRQYMHDGSAVPPIRLDEGLDAITVAAPQVRRLGLGRRHRYACAALTGLLAFGASSEDEDTLAARAHAIADAMMRAGRRSAPDTDPEDTE